jgi:hypothetical protein
MSIETFTMKTMTEEIRTVLQAKYKRGRMRRKDQKKIVEIIMMTKKILQINVRCHVQKT